MNKPITNASITRWLLLLQEFDITIIDRPRKENVVADFLSRFTNSDDNLPVEDSFPYEHLLVVSTYSPWYANVTNYLATRKLPAHLSKREKGKLFNKVPGIVG